MTQAGVELLERVNVCLSVVEENGLVNSLEDHLEKNPEDRDNSPLSHLADKNWREEGETHKALKEMLEAMKASGSRLSSAADDAATPTGGADAEDAGAGLPPQCNIDIADYKSLQQRLLNIVSRCADLRAMELASDCLWSTFDHLLRCAGIRRPRNVFGVRDQAYDETLAKALELWKDTISLIAKTMTSRGNRRAVFACSVLLSRMRNMTQEIYREEGLDEYHAPIGKTFLMVLRDAGTRDPVLAICVYQYFILYLCGFPDPAEEVPIDGTQRNVVAGGGGPPAVEQETAPLRSYYDPVIVLGAQIVARLTTPIDDHLMPILALHNGRDLFFFKGTIERVFQQQIGTMCAFTILTSEIEEWFDKEDVTMEVFTAFLKVLKKCDPRKQGILPSRDKAMVGILHDNIERSSTLAWTVAEQVVTIAECVPALFRKKVPALYHSELILQIYEYMRHPVLRDGWEDYGELADENHETEQLDEAMAQLLDRLGEVLHGNTVQNILAPVMQAAMADALAGPAESSGKKKSLKASKNGLTAGSSRAKKHQERKSGGSGIASSGTPWQDKHAAILAVSYLSTSCAETYKKNLFPLIQVCLCWIGRQQHPYLRFNAAQTLSQLCKEFTVHCREHFCVPIYKGIRNALLNPKGEEPVTVLMLARALENLIAEYDQDTEEEVEISRSSEKKIRAELKALEHEKEDLDSGDDGSESDGEDYQQGKKQQHVDPMATSDPTERKPKSNSSTLIKPSAISYDKKSKSLIQYMSRLVATTPYRWIKIVALQCMSEMCVYLKSGSHDFLPSVLKTLWEQYRLPYRTEDEEKAVGDEWHVSPEKKSLMGDEGDATGADLEKKPKGDKVGEKNDKKEQKKATPHQLAQHYGKYHNLRNTIFESFGIIGEAVGRKEFKKYAAEICAELVDFYHKIAEVVDSFKQFYVKKKNEGGSGSDGDDHGDRKWEGDEHMIGTAAAGVEDQTTRIVVASWARLVGCLGPDIFPYLEELMSCVLTVAATPCRAEVVPTTITDEEVKKIEPGAARVKVDGHYVNLTFWNMDDIAPTHPGAVQPLSAKLITVRASETKTRMMQRAVDMIAEILNDKHVRTHPNMPQWRMLAIDGAMNVLESGSTSIEKQIARMADDYEGLPDHLEPLERCADLITAIWDSFSDPEVLKLEAAKRRGEDIDPEEMKEKICTPYAKQKIELLNRIAGPILNSISRTLEQLSEIETGEDVTLSSRAIGALWDSLATGVSVSPNEAMDSSLGQQIAQVWGCTFQVCLPAIRDLQEAMSQMPEDEEEQIDGAVQIIEEYQFILDSAVSFSSEAMPKFSSFEVAVEDFMHHFAGGLFQSSLLRNLATIVAGEYVEHRLRHYEVMAQQLAAPFSKSVLERISEAQPGCHQQTAAYFVGVFIQVLHKKALEDEAEAARVRKEVEETEAKKLADANDEDAPPADEEEESEAEKGEGKGPLGSILTTAEKSASNLRKMCHNFGQLVGMFFEERPPARMDNGPLKGQNTEDDQIHPEIRVDVLGCKALEEGDYEDYEDEPESKEKKTGDHSEDSDDSDADSDSDSESEADDEGNVEWDTKVTGGDPDKLHRRGQRLSVEANFISSILKWLRDCPRGVFPCQEKPPTRKGVQEKLGELAEALQLYLPVRGEDICEAKAVHRTLLRDVVIPCLKIHGSTKEKELAETALLPEFGMLLLFPYEAVCGLAAGITRSSPKYLCKATIQLIKDNQTLLRGPIVEVGIPQEKRLREETIEQRKRAEELHELNKKKAGSKLGGAVKKKKK